MAGDMNTQQADDKKRMQHRAAFYRGVCAALTVIAGFDDEVVFREVLRDCGGEEVIQQARRDRLLRFSGFTKYRIYAKARP